MASMRGEMSQMVAERPNAGAIRHHDRRRVIRRPMGQGFVPVAAHGITPIDVASRPLKFPQELARVLSTCPCSLAWFCFGLLAPSLAAMLVSTVNPGSGTEPPATLSASLNGTVSPSPQWNR